MKLYSHIVGHGPDLICVHGNGEDHTIFNQSMPLLAKHFRCHFVDSLGHGKSLKVREFSYLEMAQALITYIKESEIKLPCYFYGFSDGGILGLLICLKEPTIIKEAILFGINTTPDGIVSWLVEKIERKYQQTFDPLLKLMLTQPNITPQELNSIQTPIHLYVGDQDIIQLQHTEMIKNNLQNATLTILPNHTHDSYVTTPLLSEIIVNHWGKGESR